MNKSPLLILLILISVTGCGARFKAMGAMMDGTQEQYIKEAGGKSVFETADSMELTILCGMYAMTGKMQSSLDCQNVHIRRFKNSKDEQDTYFVATHYYGVAGSYAYVNNFNQSLSAVDDFYTYTAEQKFDEREGYYPDLIRSYIISSHGLKALSLHHLGRDQEAEHELKIASDSLPLLEGLHETIIKSSKNSLAPIYLMMGKYEEAGNLYRDADGAFFEPSVNKKYDKGLYFLARADLEAGRYEEALAGFKELESYSSITIDPLLYWTYWHNYAQIHKAMHNLDEAIKALQKSIQIIEAQRSDYSDDLLKISFVGDKQEVYRDIIALLVDAGRADEAFAYAERGKARSLVDMLASKKQFSATHKNIQTAGLLESMSAAEATLAKRNYLTDETQRGAERALLKKRRGEIFKAQPELASLVTVTAPSVSDLQAKLPVGETLVEYYGDDKQLYAFVMSKTGVGAVKLNPAGLKQSIHDFRNALMKPRSKAYKQTGSKLYKQLIAPVVKQIKTRNVTFVPHGALHYLPFSALPTSKAHLIDYYNIRVLPSASVMTFLNKTSNAKGSLLALGNPDLGNKKLDLPGAQNEAIAITRNYKNAQLLLRKKATETAVKQYGNGFKYIHFASHGVFDPDSPLNSGLLLAKDANNDGNLTVGELYDLNLNADLVTLSACETALGKVADGDDVIGFTRGFLYAGAKTIVSSLWKVDDTATNKLMQSFYRNLNKQDKRSSLRQAQLSLKKKFSHPYYWAAFQLTGAVN